MYLKVNVVKSRKFLDITRLFLQPVVKKGFVLKRVAACPGIANRGKKRVTVWAEVAVFTLLDLLQHLILELR